MNNANTLSGEDNGRIFLLVPFPSLKLLTIVSHKGKEHPGEKVSYLYLPKYPPAHLSLVIILA